MIDTRRTIDSNGGAGSHALVRVRNRNPFDVIARVEFIAGDAVPEDGLVPSEQWNVDLGAVGASDAELVLILGRSDVTEAAVRAVQRY